MGHAPTFKSGLDGIVWPAVPTGEAATIAALVAGLQASERLPLAEIEAAQGAQLARLAAHHDRHSPAFRARLAAAGLASGALDSVARLRELAPLSRQQLQAAGKDFFAVAGAARARAGRRGHDLRLDRRAGEDEEDRRRPAVLGRLHDSRPSLARPRLRRPDDLDPADQSALRRDGGLGLPGRRAVRDRQGAGDAGHDGHRRAGRGHRPLPAAAPALLPEQPEGARRSLGGTARGPAGEHSPRSHRRRDAFGRPARPPRAHARPADRGQLLLAGGRHHRPAVPRGRALSHDGRVAGGRGARRAGPGLRRGRDRPGGGDRPAQLRRAAVPLRHRRLRRGRRPLPLRPDPADLSPRSRPQAQPDDEGRRLALPAARRLRDLRRDRADPAVPGDPACARRHRVQARLGRARSARRRRMRSPRPCARRSSSRAGSGWRSRAIACRTRVPASTRTSSASSTAPPEGRIVDRKRCDPARAPIRSHPRELPSARPARSRPPGVQPRRPRPRAAR